MEREESLEKRVIKRELTKINELKWKILKVREDISPAPSLMLIGSWIRKFVVWCEIRKNLFLVNKCVYRRFPQLIVLWMYSTIVSLLVYVGDWRWWARTLQGNLNTCHSVPYKFWTVKKEMSQLTGKGLGGYIMRTKFEEEIRVRPERFK